MSTLRQHQHLLLQGQGTRELATVVHASRLMVQRKGLKTVREGLVIDEHDEGTIATFKLRTRTVHLGAKYVDHSCTKTRDKQTTSVGHSKEGSNMQHTFNEPVFATNGLHSDKRHLATGNSMTWGFSAFRSTR